MVNTWIQLQIEEATTTFGFDMANFREEIFGDANTTLDLQTYLCFMDACTKQSDALIEQMSYLTDLKSDMLDKGMDIKNISVKDVNVAVDNYCKQTQLQ